MVVRIEVDAFDDVDLAVRWPVCAYGPERGPGGELDNQMKGKSKA